MSLKLYKILKGTNPYVILFGIFVACSLLLQCFIPFLQKMAELKNGEWAWFLALFNTQFVLPMETISNFWAAVSATYVGLDRAAYTIDAFKSGKETVALTDDRMHQLTQVIWLTFFIYGIAVVLNTIFNAELALTPLFVAFGSSILCYVAGNKAVKAFETLSPENEETEDEVDKLILDDLNKEQLTTLTRITDMMKEKKEFTIRISKESKITGVRKS